jgi:hypothetical protein
MSFHTRHASPDEVENLLWWIPSVASRGRTTWERDFARSILLQSRRHGWRPSGKQLGIMRRLVEDFRARPYSAPLIEADDDIGPLVEEG